MTTKYVVALFFIIYFHLVFGEVIRVYPDDCGTSNEIYGGSGSSFDEKSNLTQALKTVASSSPDKGQDGWIIKLEERGCYWLSEFHLIYNISSNVSIVGAGSNASHYLIQCADSVGLAFVQIKNLVITNVTIDACGVSAENVDAFSKSLNETVAMFHKVPREIGYGIAIADSQDIMISNLVIMNTQGIGLMLINVIGNSSIDDLQLLYNRASVCYYNNTSDKTIGGGMFILYQDYINTKNLSGVNLSISKVFAYGNSYCQALNLIKEINPKKLNLSVGSAGSIGVSLAQQNYGVHVLVAFSEFRNNTGWISSGVTIVMFIGVKESEVLFDNCKFIRNGYEDYHYQSLGLITAHSGLFVIKNVRFPISKSYTPINSLMKSLILVTNSLFHGNSAETCANIELVLFRPVYENDTCQITFKNTTMTRNVGMVAPVLCASSKDGVADFSDFRVDLEDVTVVDNRVDSLNDRSTQVSLYDSSGQMLFISINVILKNTRIVNNTGAGVIAVSSNIYLSENVLFHRNIANFGAGLQLLEQSHIIMENNAHVEFSENNALFSGGAIYVADSHLYADFLHSNCFLYFGELDTFCNLTSCAKLPDLEISMTFRNNTAAYGGTVFGSTLNDCPWNYDYWPNPSPDDITAIQMLAKVYPSYFNCTPPLNSSEVVSTESTVLRGVPLDDYNKTINSTTYDILYPGEEKFYNISAFDAFGFRADALLLSVSDDPAYMNSSLSDTLYWFLHASQEKGTPTPLIVKGITNKSGSIDIFSKTSSASMIVKVALSECGFGFNYDPSTQECVCDSFTPEGVTCNIKNHSLTVFHTSYWYGPAEQLVNNSAVYKPCFFHHCKLGTVSFRPYQIDSQCNTGFRRRGLLCSQCEEGTGMMFGSNKCKECDNKNIFILIPLFAAAGIFIIVLIAFLDISVAHGYVNGFIFYCNCLNFFLPYLSSTPNLGIDYIFVFVSWINLSLGIEACFYNGMSELVRIGLRLVFPAYLYFLMFLIVILSKYSKTVSKIPFSFGRTFATIFILTYFSIFGTCVNLLGFMSFKPINEDIETPTYYGWQADVNIPYGHGGHIYLVVLSAILIAGYVIPIPLFLMFPPLLYRFRYTQKLKPVLDAFWNPYRPSQRFWLGARALFRFTAFFLALYVSFPTNVFTFGMIIIICWFIQERFSPYQGFLCNSLDSFFVMNLVMVLFLAIHFDSYGQSYKSQYQALLYCIVSTAYMAFAGIVVIHLLLRFPYLKDRAKKICCLGKYYHYTKTNGDNDNMSSDDDDDDGSLNVGTPHSKVVTFTEFREPLLDGSINTNSYSINS